MTAGKVGRSVLVPLLVVILCGLVTNFALAARFSPSQGAGTGGGGVSNPATEDLAMNGNKITGTVLESLSITSGAGSETVLTQAQGSSLVNNIGTTVKASVKLPASPSVGTFYDFLNCDSDGFRVVANTSQVITCGALGNSASAGYVESVRMESAFRLVYTATNSWRATRVEGTWRKDSTTSAGFAFTPTSWISWTPTSATWLANVTFTGLYRQVGNVIESQIKVAVTGTPTTASLTINNWAGGFTPSSTNVLSTRSTNDYQVFFYGTSVDDSANSSRMAQAALNSDGTIYFGTDNTINSITQSAPFTWANGDSCVVVGHYAVD